MEFEDSLLIQRSNVTKLVSRQEYNQRMTLHCQQCNTVLGDSFGVCGEIRYMDSILCLKVTSDVVVGDAMEFGHKGEMTSCIYSSLKCGGCRCTVGKVIHCSPSRLAAVRSLFLLHKANISCYILDCCSMVKASTLTFDLKPLRENMNMVRRQFEEQLDEMLRIKSRLADRSVNGKLVK